MFDIKQSMEYRIIFNNLISDIDTFKTIGTDITITLDLQTKKINSIHQNTKLIETHVNQNSDLLRNMNKKNY